MGVHRWKAAIPARASGLPEADAKPCLERVQSGAPSAFASAALCREVDSRRQRHFHTKPGCANCNKLLAAIRVARAEVQPIRGVVQGSRMRN
jgi:hypothetical protein